MGHEHAFNCWTINTSTQSDDNRVWTFTIWVFFMCARTGGFDAPWWSESPGRPATWTKTARSLPCWPEPVRSKWLQKSEIKTNGLREATWKRNPTTYLAIEVDLTRHQAWDELVVRQAVLARRRVDALNPQRAPIALLHLAITAWNERAIFPPKLESVRTFEEQSQEVSQIKAVPVSILQSLVDFALCYPEAILVAAAKAFGQLQNLVVSEFHHKSNP